MCHNGSGEELPADRGLKEESELASGGMGKGNPASGNSVCKALGAESWVVGAQRRRSGDLICTLTVQGRTGTAQSSPASQQQSPDETLAPWHPR